MEETKAAAAEERQLNFIEEIVERDLQEGKHKSILTRFPPEPNGYLHIGSANAIWINYTAAKKYGGEFNLRYDDTNPVKEDDEYVRSIEDDLRWLGAEPDGIFYGSDYFDKCYEYAEKLIIDGKAFVCDLSQEQMSEYRGTLTEEGRESPYRSRSVEENLDIFRRMKAGEFAEGERTLRAKIDMKSPNMNMRDPVIYRILFAHHHRQGDKWCIYPMYDFAHPIQDAIEGITHSLCSIEFENHRPLYDWVVDNIGIEKKPHQYEFARLNMTYTVMSKRYLRKLVETNKVDGWDDPRMPTLCGLRRKGYTPTAIFDFIERNGVSKTYSMADVRFLEYCICEELNETTQRRVAIIEPLKVTITNYPTGKTEYFEMSNHPKKPELGKRELTFTRELFIDKSDFMAEPVDGFIRLVPNGEVRLMSAYILKCNEVVFDEKGEPCELLCTVDLETRNNKPADGRKVKGTIHWLSADHTITANVRYYNQLFNKENVATLLEDDNFDEFLSEDSLVEYINCKLEPSLEGVAAGERFQFVRTGYFTKDSKFDGVFNRIAPLKSSFKPE